MTRASEHGVDTAESVRAGLIELRNAMLEIQRWDETLLLSHAIWWLSTITENNGHGAVRT